MHKKPTEAEFNLGWVFEQLLQEVEPEPQQQPPSLDSKKSLLFFEGMLGGSGGGAGAGTVGGSTASSSTLRVEHIAHVFNFLGVQLSNEEMEEMLHMMDLDGDGRVSQEDFMRAMLRSEPTDSAASAVASSASSSSSTPSPTSFDSRYAVHIPWGALDSSTKDGVLSEEDFRAARSKLGKMFGVEDSVEFRMVARQLAREARQPPSHSQQASLHSGVSSTRGSTELHLPPSGHLSSPSFSSTLSSSSSFAPLPSIRRAPHQLIDKDTFRRIVARQTNAKGDDGADQSGSGANRRAATDEGHNDLSATSAPPASRPTLNVSFSPSTTPSASPFLTEMSELELGEKLAAGNSGSYRSSGSRILSDASSSLLHSVPPRLSALTISPSSPSTAAPSLVSTPSSRSSAPRPPPYVSRPLDVSSRALKRSPRAGAQTERSVGSPWASTTSFRASTPIGAKRTEGRRI